MNNPNKKYLSVEQINDAIIEINKKLILSKWSPDVIISLNRGGCVPGVYLSHLINVPHEVIDIKKVKYKEIPAVTHVDGTGRMQSVDKQVSPRYHRLISKFAEKTGVPVLLNTSFNENEPIVNNPEEALDCFLRTDMDMLVMENIIIQR